MWRAVDRHGNVLEILVQSRRKANAAKRFFHKLMTKQGRFPRVLATDKIARYLVAQRD
nr:DDE-type integrase/transposase/recombinase [Rhodococcus globerulus]